MKHSRKFLALLLALMLLISIVPTALATNTTPKTAADKLHTLGLLAGTSTNPDGSPNYSLDGTLTREAAITLIVNILGKYEEATSESWETPFTDLTSWAVPFVGYAYSNGLTTGKSNTSFGSKDAVTAKQFITFVLNALGYDPSTDFKYDTAWEKSDELGFTDGRYNASTQTFVRGDAIAITYDALSAIKKDTRQPLYEQLISDKVITRVQADTVGLGVVLPETGEKAAADIIAGKKLIEFGGYSWRVLNVEEDSALLITDSIVDVRAYHDEYVDTIWEKSTLREYLNGDFYNSFSASDRSQILLTHVINANSAQKGYPGGNDTDDKIFLLSLDEANTYFGSSEERIAYLPTALESKLKQIYKDDYFFLDHEIASFIDALHSLDNAIVWWLRSPSDGGYDSKCVVNPQGKTDENRSVNTKYVGVRPTLIINLKP
jgi:hypothetical protein